MLARASVHKEIYMQNQQSNFLISQIKVYKQLDRLPARSCHVHSLCHFNGILHLYLICFANRNVTNILSVVDLREEQILRIRS